METSVKVQIALNKVYLFHAQTNTEKSDMRIFLRFADRVCFSIYLCCRFSGRMEIIMAHGIITPEMAVYITSAGSVAGHEENKGPLGGSFDIFDSKDDRFAKETWEQAESEMQKLAVGCTLMKGSYETCDIDAILAGDLLNQCVGSNYGLSDYRIPYFGLYGACSTAAEGLLLSSLLCSSAVRRCIAVTSSHFCSAERQFRYPLEYGGQRPPTAQWTVTGSGAFAVSSILTDVTRLPTEYVPRITEVLPGYVIDRGISDVNNMGAAMAPAAADTLYRYFSEGRNPEDFDLIITGDLGREGSGILTELLQSKNIDISANHVDCGCIIYNTDEADKHAGGSGCGCSAVVMAAHILKNICDGTVKDVLFVGTGALMSPLVLNQGSTIPGIGHLVRITAERIER